MIRKSRVSRSARSIDKPLTATELEMMNVVWRIGPCSVQQVVEQLRPERELAYTSVSTIVRILEQKGLLRHETDGARYVYKPVLTRHKARQSAIEHLLTTFFNGSAAGAVLTLLERPGTELAPEELDRMARLIEQARNEERK